MGYAEADTVLVLVHAHQCMINRNDFGQQAQHELNAAALESARVVRLVRQTDLMPIVHVLKLGSGPINRIH
jgi:hypothetical protein